ncbi:MAG: helix-turn-helix transcriptional regulator [Lachnospiraceae bacterium]|nr:helix-turn-helix transcriptional regulator [Lachnospiraceae bacterium]
MTFGQVIKKARRNADMTQEQLAEILSVSPQAISRWETDSAMPDISMLPAICNVFDISADELLGINAERKAERIEGILREARVFSGRGYYSEARDILEKGFREFPNSHQLMRDLMYVAYWQSEQLDKYNEEEIKAFTNQAISLGERLLETCVEDYVRHSAIQILCFAYCNIGEDEKAKELALTMPIIATSQELLLTRVLKGSDKYYAKQREVYMLLQNFGNCIGGRHNTKLDSGEWAYTNDEVAKLRDKKIAIYDIMFEEGDYGFYHCHLSACHEAQARYYAENGNADKVLHHLSKAAWHAVSFVSCCEGDGKHTSLIFRGYEEYGSFSMSETDNEAMCILKKMQDSVYDFVRDRSEFTKAEEELREYADKWKVEV